jgi:hypothetical protein
VTYSRGASAGSANAIAETSGCLGAERRAEKGKNMTHGKSNTRVYEIWHGMKKRCLNRKCKAYPRYGGRGITVCDRWLTFENFLADMGEPPPGASIERLHNDRGYEIGNCIWADGTTQARNRRNARVVEMNGEKLPLVVAADRLGIQYSTAYYRFFVSPVTGNPETVQKLVWED